MSEAFDAADATPFTAEALAGLPAERWPELRLFFHSSLRCLALHHNAPELWHAATEGRALAALTTGNTCDWLVWRRSLAVYYHRLENSERGLWTPPAKAPSLPTGAKA